MEVNPATRYITVTIPSAYEIPLGPDGRPAFYKLVNLAGHTEVEADFSLTPRQSAGTRFTLITVADAHVQNNTHLARFAEKYGYSMTVAETHHIHKLDKPSGTAAKLANDIIAESSRYQSWSIEEPMTPADSTISETSSDVLPIEVTREGEVFGIHSVTALSSADRITLTHEAFSREGLAKGALAAAQFLMGRQGCFTMEDLFDQNR